MSSHVEISRSTPPHLRGFVYSKPHQTMRVGGPTHVHYWGVRNMHTGQVVASDNTGCTLARAMDEAAVMVLVARSAWRWGLDQEQLKREG